jgi:hypothetical protein
MNYDWFIKIKVMRRVIPVLFFYAPRRAVSISLQTLKKSTLKVNHIPARFKLAKLHRCAVPAWPEP